MDYEPQSDPEFHVLTGLSSEDELWAEMTWSDRTAMAPSRTSTGEDVAGLVDARRLDEVPFPVWFEQSPCSRDWKLPRADLIWAGASAFKLVSERFARVLAELGVTGYEVSPADFRDQAGRPIPGYLELGEDLGGASEVTTLYRDGVRRSFALLVSQRVLDGLLDAGVTRFNAVPFRAVGGGTGRGRPPRGPSA